MMNSKPWSKEGWKPKCKQDVVDLLMEVQAGNVSCRRASDILFPKFKMQSRPGGGMVDTLP